MSGSQILSSLKVKAIEKIEALQKFNKLYTIPMEMVTRDINRMQTLPEVIEFISLSKLDIDMTDLQEDFNAELRAAAKSSVLPSTGPTAIASHRRHDEKVVGDLRVVSWEVPAKDFDAEQCAAATPSFLPSVDPAATAFHRRLDENSAFITALRDYFLTADVYVPLQFIDSLSNLGDATVIFTIYFGFDYFSARNLIDSLQAQYGTLEEGVDDDLSGNSTYPASIAESGGQGYMGDTATVSTPCAEEVTVAEREAAFDPSVCPADDTLSQSEAIEEGVEVIIHLAAADPLPDPPDPLSGDTVGDAAPMVAPTTDAATMAMPCARHDVSPVGPTPPPDPFLKGFLRDANPGLSPWPCCSVPPRSVCPAAPNYAEKPDFARRLRPYRGL